MASTLLEMENSIFESRLVISADQSVWFYTGNKRYKTGYTGTKSDLKIKNKFVLKDSKTGEIKVHTGVLQGTCYSYVQDNNNKNWTIMYLPQSLGPHNNIPS